MSGKVKQCRDATAPSLIAVCHLHQWETIRIGKHFAEELLISDTGYTFAVNRNDPLDRTPGYMFTELRDALFLAIDAQGLQTKRHHVSGVLMFGFGAGIEQTTVIGCRNPSALRPFDPSTLPTIVFAEAQIQNGRIGLKYYNET